MRQAGLQEELANLYFELLTQKVKDQYRGHEDYHMMLNAIDSRIPILGGKINIKKEDSKGNFRTVTYNVTVKDDLGNFINSIDDIGGQCIKGEIVKKGSIFICMECGELVCRRHVKFVDRNQQKPLCCYGFVGWDGCYHSYKKTHSVKRIGNNYDDAPTQDLEELLKRKSIISDISKLDQEIKQTTSGVAPRQTLTASHHNNILAPPKKAGRLSRLMWGSVHSIKCGNPACGKRIWLSNYVCQSCRNVVDLHVDNPLFCPRCNAPVKQVQCPECQATNIL